MFTEIDKILYPNRCEVIEIAPQRFVFPIFKNGSSSLRAQAKKDGWKILFNEQIKRCKTIEVYLRDPKQRMASGAGSYYDDLCNDVMRLDPNTVQHFMYRYPYLDRHYIPQLHWLINLGRYMNHDTQLILKDLNQLSYITEFHKSPDRKENPTKDSIISGLSNTVFYLELDNHLYGMIDKQMTLKDILVSMKSEHPVAYDHVFGHAKRLIDVLP